MHLVDYLILLFIISLAIYMFGNTRNRVTSNSNTNEEILPFISNIDYIKEDKNRSSSLTYYLNEENKFFIKLEFSKKVEVAANTSVRLLFNNNTYIDRKVAEGSHSYILIEGDNTIHYEQELKVIDVDVISGYIKDEDNNELSTRIEEELISKQTSLYVLNKKPVLTAVSEKSFYTSNSANIIIETNNHLVNSYCISEDEICTDYIEYESNIINYSFNANEENKKLCVFIKDKAGNVSDCSLVEFDYYASPSIKFEIEEGEYVKSNEITVNIETKINPYANISEYCLYLEGNSCSKKTIVGLVKEKILLDNIEGEKTIKLKLFDNNKEFEYVKKVILDKSAPTLDFTITNKDKISNYKDVLINYSDNTLLHNDNKYEYCLSTSDTTLAGSIWTSYENNKKFRIRNVNDGDYYLWIRDAKDQANNSYSNGEYILISEKLSFDNSKPIINIVTDEKGITENNLVKEFIITCKDNNEIYETILDESSIIISSTTKVNYKLNIIETDVNNWLVQVIFEKESLASGYFSLTILSNLIEDIAGNKNDSSTSNLIKIN